MAARPLTPGGKVGVVHVHTDYSHDGKDSVERLRDFALARGIGFVGLTDHAEDLSPAQFDELAARCRAASDDRVSLIAGLEYRFEGYSGLHLLALGLSRRIDPRTPEEFIAQASTAARFTIAAHPGLFRYRLPESVAQGIDAIEVWNAAYNTRYLPDPAAVRLLERVRRRRPEVVGTAGLDQHDSRNDRGTRVVLLDPRAADPLAELKAGRFVNRGTTMDFAARAAFGPPRLAALTALRAGLDLVNFVHERSVRALRSRA
jgi:hypothetical protein